jgi:SecD/SecF fusion protein
LRKLANETVKTTFDRLNKRIDKLGVVQPNVQLDAARDMIVVELPGIDNPVRAREFLQAAAKLEFWEVYRNTDVGVINGFFEADKILKGGTSLSAVPETKDTTQAVDSTGLALSKAMSDTTKPATAAADTAAVEKGVLTGLFTSINTTPQPSAVIAVARETNIKAINSYLDRPEVKAKFPRDLVFKWASSSNKDEKKNPTGEFVLYAVKKSRNSKSGAALDGDHVTSASPSTDPLNGRVEVSMSMDNEGAKKWGQLTTRAAADQNREVAVVLDDEVVSAPRVNDAITNGNSRIMGDYTILEAQDLSNILQIGKLPAKPVIIKEDVIGPSLGKDNIKKSLISIVMAFLATVAFMIWYYRGGGVVAVVALIINLFLLMGALTSYGVVLTLPGIAGIVLTMGMAVDANVIIYERIREELRLGKATNLAIREGFKHSMSAIIDGNLTTLLVGIVLAVLGLGSIKGFGFVLSIGIITTLFTTILVSRMIVDWWIGKGKNITFFAPWSENAFKNFHYDWMGFRKKAYMISGSIILAGLIAIAVRGFELGVDFKGGYSYNVQFDKEIPADKLRTSLSTAFGGASTIVKTISTVNTYNITTSYMVNESGEQVAETVLGKLLEGVNAATGTNTTLEAFRKTDGAGTHVVSFTKVGPSVAEDMKRSSVWAAIAGLTLIFLYILLRFNRWQYSVGAVIATMNDVLIVLSMFAIFHGILPFSMEVDQTLIAALLTIIGYSINDTVIIYDRIREYMQTYTKQPMRDVLNNAINSTLSRTIITSGTVFLVSLVLFIFGGSSIKGFSFAMIVGVITGTYSSICIAAPIMFDLSKNLDLTEKDIKEKKTTKEKV